MATSIFPSPIRLCSAMDRRQLSPAKRMAIGSDHDKRPSIVDVVDLENSSFSLSAEEQDNEHGSLISLLRNIPQKTSSPNLKRFQMYPTVVDVYSSLRNGEPLPTNAAKLLEDRATKRRVYQALFEVLHSK